MTNLNENEPLDLFIVVCNKDIKLLRHFFLSYELFFKSPGDIHLMIWEKDKEILAQIKTPSNVFIHYKDDVQGLCDDDFRNQMYLKMISNKFVNTEWFWVLDADYLICAPIKFSDFCYNDKPLWYYCAWYEVAEKMWRSGTERFLGCNVPYQFLHKACFILNRSILLELQKQVKVNNILSMEYLAADCAAYGFFTFQHYFSMYSWVDATENDSSCITFLLNQRPPSYCILNAKSTLSEIGKAKCAVFWSHWDMADQKMQQFLVEAQIREFGEVLVLPSSSDLKLLVSIEDFLKQGAIAWDGCYTDGWVKKESFFLLSARGAGSLKLELLPACGERNTIVYINTNGSEQEISLNPGVNTISIPVNGIPNIRDVITIKFLNGFDVSRVDGRILYARVTNFEYSTS